MPDLFCLFFKLEVIFDPRWIGLYERWTDHALEAQFDFWRVALCG